jgi:uracil-DNA glycosylase
MHALPALQGRNSSGAWRRTRPCEIHAGGRAAGRQGRPRREAVRRPAGRILDQALADAGIPRRERFITNAVKHFKYEMRDKRRLHKKPNAYEIERCKLWLDLERLIVKPEIVLALGATAARSLLGRVVTITKVRGAPIDLHDGSRLVVTVHPSALLRTEDEADKRAKYAEFVKDLKIAARLALRSAA